METAPDNSLSQELDAMAAIGQLLGGLTDLAARQRVLNWATERFAPGALSSPKPLFEPGSPEPVTADPALAVDSLDDMFAIVGGAVAGEELDSDFAIFEPDEETSKLPIEVVVRSFAADFQRFAEEWNGASA